MQSMGGFDSTDRTGGTGRGDDLRAMATLDAMGMLDEVDAAEFDRAFRDAAPALQAELRELQAAVAADPAFLAQDEEPSADLKARTIARVMTELDRNEASLAPIAHIGRTATQPRRGAAPAVDHEAFLAQAIELATVRQDARRLMRSSYYWRAATIALTAALTVAFVFQVTTRSFAERVAELALGAASTDQLLKQLGNDGAGRDVESADWLRGMRGVDGSGLGAAVMAADLKDGRITLVGIGLKAGLKYRLNWVAESGATGTHEFFASRANWTTVMEDLSAGQLRDIQSARLELVDADGKVVMAG